MFKSVQQTILAAFLGLLLPMIAVFAVISTIFIEDTLTENSTEYTMELIAQMNMEMDSYINYMENISRIVMLNPDVNEFLTIDYTYTEQRAELEHRIQEQFYTMLSTREDIVNIAVYGKSGRYILNDGAAINPNIDVREMEWYKRAMEANGEICISSSHVQNLEKNHYTWVVTLSRALLDRKTGEKLGAMLVDLNYSVIHDLCQKINLGDKGYIFLLDENGGILYHPKQQLIYNGLLNENVQEVMRAESEYFTIGKKEEKKLYMRSSSQVTGWTAVGVANVTELFIHKKAAITMYGIIACVMAAISVTLSGLLSNTVTRPIKRLKISMKEVEKGNFGSEIPITGRNEVAALSRAYNLMIRRIQALMEAQIQAQKLKRKNELRVLRAQINPHFLYNTLDSIIWMAESGKNQEVVKMTSSLARLLRQSISSESEEATVDQEITYVKNYLVIQKMRYRDQLNYQIDVQEKVLECQIIRLLLQPIVENAIYHGIKYKDGEGNLWIRGYEKENKLILEVEDDGIGMTQEELAHIFDKKKEKKGSGVGVQNVNERIKLHYGKEYGLFYQSEYEKGTIATMKLPILLGGEGREKL